MDLQLRKRFVLELGEWRALMLRIPAARAAFWMLGALCVAYTFLLRREGMIDNANYVDYFRDGSRFEWFVDFLSVDSILGAVAGVFMNEILWLLWTSFIGQLMDPGDAVYATVGILNLILVYAIRDYRNPLLALVLWLALPYGFAILGIYQLRQGMAFAVWLLLAIRWNRPITGSVVAAMIHSTFAVVVPIAFIATRKWIPVWGRFACILVFAITFAYFGQSVFDQFGGRRIEVYELDGESFSINFVVGMVVLLAYPVWASLFENGRGAGGGGLGGFDLRSYHVFYAGVLVYLVTCYFMFPLGLYRINYLALLGLLPIIGNAPLGNLRVGRLPKVSMIVLLGPVLLMLAYWTIKAFNENRYACAYLEDCAATLTK